jgi:chromosome partitioning protein
MAEGQAGEGEREQVQSVRSASPPAATSERAGIAEASPAGERSGRGAVPGPAQDGETSTVDQSREWPYRDTAPRQDPAESRLNPIWGSDPPDAVRWHMGMTPTEQERPATGSPGDQASSHAEAQPRAHEAPAVPPARSEADEGTAVSPPDPEASEPPPRQPGDHERDPLDPGDVDGNGSSPPEEPPAPVPHARAQRIAPPAAPEDQASSAVSTPMDSATVGWFSTSANPAQKTRTLSERLSAERPVDEPVGGLADGDDASPGSAGDPAAPSPSTGHPTRPTADTQLSTGTSQVEESHGADIPRSTESRSGASGDATAMPSGDAPRGPELIEAGMVYVDPDPEIGPPSTVAKAAGWKEQPPVLPSPGTSAAWQGQPIAAGSASIEEMHGAEASSLPGENPIPTGLAQNRAVGSGEPQGQHDADVPYHQLQHGADDQHPRGMRSTPPAATAADAGSIDERPWTEPALPMGGLPVGTPSPRGEREARQHDESATDETDEPSIPRPDPSWPRLFEQRQGTSQSRGDHTSNTQMLAGSGPGTESGRGSDEPEERAAPPPGSAQGGAEPTSGGMAAQGPTVPEEQATEPAAIVNLTEVDGPAPGADPPQVGPAPEQSAAGPRPQSPRSFAAGADTPEQANISTVAQIADAAEVDLRDRPVSPRGEDVSRETSAGGGKGMEPAQEQEALEDEAALAVREAVSRAAAEAGVDVSRETELMDASSSLDSPAGERSIDSESAARNARVSFRIHREALNGRRRVLAVANQKGGVGKSTTAVNIGAYLALAGARVLVVDLDPQGNASTGLGLDHRDIEPSIYDVLTGDAPPTAAIRSTGVANLHVLPSTIDLAGAEVELVSAMSRETRLRRALESIDHQYDTILIDCPPSLGLLTVNALAAANELLIPIQCEYYALEGLGQLLRNVELVRANLNPELRIGGIVLTMYDGRTRLALQVVDEVRKHFTDLVYQTVVPRSVRLSEAPGYGLPIALYDPLSRGGIAYRDLTFELAERSGLLAPTGEGAS